MERLPQAEFRFAYRHGASECRVGLCAHGDGRLRLTFMVAEPGAAPGDRLGMHMATTLWPAARDDRGDAPDALAETLLEQLYADDLVRHFAPGRVDRARMQQALAAWLTRAD